MTLDSRSPSNNKRNWTENMWILWKIYWNFGGQEHFFTFDGEFIAFFQWMMEIICDYISMKFCLAPTMLNSKTEKTRAMKAVNGAVASAAVLVWVCAYVSVCTCMRARLCNTWNVTSFRWCSNMFRCQTQCDTMRFINCLMQLILDSFWSNQLIWVFFYFF